MTLVPRSWLRNRTETVATEAWDASRSAIGHFFTWSLVTVQGVFVKVNSSQFLSRF